MIDPGTHLDGELVEDYCRRRWGGSGWTQHLKSEGAKAGASFSDWKIWPHTLKAHQLIQYCHERHNISTDSVNQALFHAEYEKGMNISNVQVLVEIARNLGVSCLEPLREYLQQDQGRSSVQTEISSGRSRYGIRGVSYFVVRGQDPSKRPFGFSGAQESDVLVELFQEVAGDGDDDRNE